MVEIDRGRASRLAYWNGATWAIGNGLASSPLILYLAMECNVAGLGRYVGLILAAPHLVGLLRLGVPSLLGRIGGRKRFCVAMFALSGLVLAALPMASVPSRSRPAADALTALVAFWCAYQLCEYLGTVALWSWLADLVPQEVRGRFVGRRESWMVAGQAAAMLASGLFVWGWQQMHPLLPRWIGYAVPVALGAGFVLASTVPLMRMPAIEGRSDRGGVGLRGLLAPLAQGRFLRLLAVGCWIAICNGLIQSPQNIFPNRVLGLSLFTMLALKVGLRLGQWPISPWLGRLVDRRGNRPVMAVSLLIVAQGPVFYFLATPQRPWWIVGAWVCWIAWSGLNIGLPNLMLKLSPASANTPYIATYFALTGLCHGLSTIAGGMLFDRFAAAKFAWLGASLDGYQMAFLFGWITWSLGGLLLPVVVQEPQGKTPTCDRTDNKTV